MSNIKDKITRDPTYSVKKPETKGGNYIVTYSVQIDGKEYIGHKSALNETTAKMEAKKALVKNISNNPAYERDMQGVTPSNLEKALGGKAITQEDPQSSRFHAAALAESQGQQGSESSPLAPPSTQQPGANGSTSVVGGGSRPAPQNNSNQDKYHIRTQKQKNHVPWKRAFAGTGEGPYLDGKGDFKLEEPVPTYPIRKGEKIVEGENNTCIVLGRDRSPTNRFFFSKSTAERDYVSGYSDYMCAGAIDIVAGRMAPFPLDRSTRNKYGEWVVAPAFNTISPPDLQGEKLEAGDHPGIMMDAARIYISQMTNIDENFKITRKISTVQEKESDPVHRKWNKQKVVPTSGIMLKADKVRMHSRQDIKIVTGGPSEVYNSLGNAIRQNNGIHLIAENGIDRDGNVLPQHPMVLGNNLVKVLEYNCILMEDVVNSMDAMCEIQMRFNSVIKDNFHLIPVAGGTPDIPNPFTQLAGIVTQLELLIKTRFGALFQLINNFRARTTYLSETSDDQNFILSRHNTVN